jgi:hypothetical protein
MRKGSACPAKTRQVIAIEPHGYGHTADSDIPFTCEQVADDPRFTPAWAALLLPEAVRAAGGEMGERAWRHWGLAPGTPLRLAVAPMPHGHTACHPYPLAELRKLLARHKIPL